VTHSIPQFVFAHRQKDDTTYTKSLGGSYTNNSRTNVLWISAETSQGFPPRRIPKDIYQW